MKYAVITGASSGLGKLIRYHLDQEGWMTYNWSLDTDVDITDKDSVERAADALPAPKIDLLVNCAGVNAIEFIPKLEEAEWDRILDTNAKGIFLVSQALLPLLSGASMASGGTIINIVSNAAHMPMTSSLAYNASKGAALIMTKQMSRELSKTHCITVFSISPNKLSGTRMSEYIDSKVCELRGWTPEEARAYQIANLPAGEETDPDMLAEFISFLMSSKQRHRFLAGCDIPYGL